VEEKAFRAHWGAAQGTRGGRRVRSVLEWQGGGRVSAAQTRGVARGSASADAIFVEVRFRRSSNAHRIAGLSQCVGCGVIQKEECKHLWERKMCPSVLGVGWSVKARRTLTMGIFTVSHVG